jgi:Ala-tRNA(Pro) deacylase
VATLASMSDEPAPPTSHSLHDPAALEAELAARFEALGITAHTVEHAPVMTVEEARSVRTQHDGPHAKNLFVRNKKGVMYLVTLLEDRAVDLKDLGRRIGAGHLSFASHERLRTYLGVEPGSVTPLAALADRDRQVTVVLDRALVDAGLVHVHPLRNDRTTGLRSSDLVRFLESVGHPPVVIDFDEV